MGLGDHDDPTWVEFRREVAGAIARRRRHLFPVRLSGSLTPAPPKQTLMGRLRQRLPWFLGGTVSKH